MNRFKKMLVLVVVVLVADGSRTADAGLCAFDQIVVFGDSLSDTGNLYNAAVKASFGFTGYLEPPKFTIGRFTDGADTTPKSVKYVANGRYNVVWHEQLARLAGIDPALAASNRGGGTNYAYGGAQTGDGTSTVYDKDGVTIKADNMGTQLNKFFTNGNFPANPLYVLWGGGNDLRDQFLDFNDNLIMNGANIKATDASVVAAAKTAADNIAGYLSQLVGEGGTMFLWPDIPSIDKTPRFLAIDAMNLTDGTTIGKALADGSLAFKTEEEKQIAALNKQFAGQGLMIAEMDVYTVFNNIIANPNKYGYTNATMASQGRNVNPDDYLFWDPFHPTSHTHSDLGALAVQSLVAAGICTPEPSTWLLATVGIAALAVRRTCAARRAS